MKQLGWLPTNPDFGAALRAARAEANPGVRLRAAVALASCQRDFIQTARLDQVGTAAAAALRAAEGDDELQPYRIAILASHTVDHLLPAIRVAGLVHGLRFDVFVAPFGQYRQSLLETNPDLMSFAPHMIVLSLDTQDSPVVLPLTASTGDVADAVGRRVAELRQLWRRAREQFGATVVQQTFLPAELPLFGSFDLLVEASPRAIVDRMNTALRDAARVDGVLLLDMAWCALLTGNDVQVADMVRWHHAKQLVQPAASVSYGEVLARIAAASCGRARKCLVLDLDNTLWGGVVGDDGVDGLILGQGEANGEAFVAFQRYIASLAQRGIILAVCSKNDIAIAEAGFSHAGMILQRRDIAAFVANWDDKATNLRLIARTLQIGLDSLVFVDDNPAERDLVRRELPEVAVPEMSEDIADYPMILAFAGYFEAVSFTQDDATRASSYTANAARAIQMDEAVDLDSYLRDLGMRMTATRVGPADTPRTVQLLNKTNQFNLMTRRFSEAAFAQFLDTPGAQAWAFRLSDRFGDNGIISVVLLRPDPTCAERALLVDSWVMSCRVLGRKVESAVAGLLAHAAAQSGMTTLVGQFRPTARNDMVAGHYERLGFTQADDAEAAADGTVSWHYDIARGAPFKHFIEVIQL